MCHVSVHPLTATRSLGGCQVDGGGELLEVDLENGVQEWRRRGLPPGQGNKAQRWGASYDLQFRILFIR